MPAGAVDLWTFVFWAFVVCLALSALAFLVRGRAIGFFSVSPFVAIFALILVFAIWLQNCAPIF